jgi:hypothetical protein
VRYRSFVSMRHAFVLMVVSCGSAATPTTTLTAPIATSTASTTPPAHLDAAPIEKSKTCKEGFLTYLGFRGSGPPPRALLDAIKARFPDVMVLEVADGNLGVLTAEPHSLDVRARHEAAAATVGWKGDVVDFPHVTSDCQATFNTPLPPPTK